MAVNKPTQSTLAPNVAEDPSLSRLLFSETLIEEYEGLDQPELDQEELNKIKNEISAYHEELRSYESGDRKDEPIFDEGEVLKRLYALINKAQREHVQQLRSSFDDESRNSYHQMEEKKERAFVSDVLGNAGPLKRQGNSNGAARYGIPPFTRRRGEARWLYAPICLVFVWRRHSQCDL